MSGSGDTRGRTAHCRAVPTHLDVLDLVKALPVGVVGRIIDHAVALVVEGAGRLRGRWAGNGRVKRAGRRPGATRCEGEARGHQAELETRGLHTQWLGRFGPYKEGTRSTTVNTPWGFVKRSLLGRILSPWEKAP